MDHSGYDFLVVGAGIFGLSTALELKNQGANVAIVDAGEIPNPMASSTDISKAVRMEYGADQEYMKMADAAIDKWQAWNDQFGTDLYHQVGFLLLTQSSLETSDFEWNCWQHLIRAGFHPVRLDQAQIARKYPAFNHQKFVDGLYHARGGFALAAATVKQLCNYAKSIGIKIHENQKVEKFTRAADRVIGVSTDQEIKFHADHTIVCAGNFTPYLLPELAPFFNITGHPVFHIQPRSLKNFLPERFPVFAADISNTGWYGFPLHPVENVVKIARHGPGTLLHPGEDNREVASSEESDLKEFLKSAIPELYNEPVVFAQRCCYTDTLDGHFWIDRHPTWLGLTVGSGGSGHGFKMGPVVGQMIAEVSQGRRHNWSDRYNWRQLSPQDRATEEARHHPSVGKNSSY